jgi:hypothetical protein
MNARFHVFAIFSVVALLLGAAIAARVTTIHAQSQVLWSADHEGPGESDWYAPGGLNFGGGEFDSGCSSSSGAGWAGTSIVMWDNDPTTPYPPAPPDGGNFGLAMVNANSCGGGQAAGTRMFRWAESRAYDDLYYKVWYYFPQNYTLTGDPAWFFWNIFSWKSKLGTLNDSFYQINIYNRPITGNMYLSLYNWQTQTQIPRIPGTETIDVPVNQWFYIEAFYKSRGDDTGQVQVWQDGTLFWDVQNVQTKYTGGLTEWAVMNYTSGLTPQPAYFFIDNAEIRTP